MKRDYTYKIKENEPTVEGEESQVVIERHGGVQEFTMEAIAEHVKRLETVKKEIDAKLEVDNAKLANIEVNHPFVKEMSDLDMSTIHLYMSIKEEMFPYAEKGKEVVDQLAQYEEDVAEIKKQLPEVA